MVLQPPKTISNPPASSFIQRLLSLKAYALLGVKWLEINRLHEMQTFYDEFVIGSTPVLLSNVCTTPFLIALCGDPNFRSDSL